MLGKLDMSTSAEKRPADRDPKARFRNARRYPDFTIDQNWSVYSPAEHNRWDRLFKRSHATLRNRACGEFLAMMETLELSPIGYSRHGKVEQQAVKAHWLARSSSLGARTRRRLFRSPC